jgi:hypothetical protein
MWSEAESGCTSGHLEDIAVANLLHFRRKDHYVVRSLGWAGLAVSIAALGLFVGRELRVRYKFNHRTPIDFYKHAGDQTPPDYAMGI